MPQPTEINKKRILITDDDGFYREAAAVALSRAGYDIVQAASGEECLAALTDGLIDIALLDLTMPTLSGFEVLTRIREMPATANLPVVVVTGKNDQPSIEMAYGAGATSFLVKPINWSLLPHHIDYVLRAARTESNLRDALRTAEFLSRLKSGFATMLARELRKPLGAIRAETQALGKEARPAGDTSVRSLAAASDHLDQVVLRMIHAGSLLSEDALLREQRVGLKRLIADAIDSCAAVAERRGVSIRTELSFEGPVELVCDPALVGQAIRSLVDNAVEFSVRGATVVVRAQVGENSELSVVVEDSAPPLSKDEVRRLFNVGDAHSTTARPGIATRDTGLAVSRVLAEAHQGSFGINATAGGGNLAILALPASRVMRGGGNRPLAPSQQHNFH